MTATLPIQHNFSLRNLNTFGLPAVARAYLRIDDPAMLEQVRQDAALRALPRLVLGGGSNLVLTGDVDGLVLHMTNRGITLLGRDAQHVLIRAAAGESWQALVEWTLAHGFGGLENLSLIPGSVGAAPIQNIGAYGLEVGARIASLRYVDFDSGALVTLDRGACEFGYRQSIFKQRLHGKAVIVDVTFALPIAWQANLGYAELRDEVQRSLQETQLRVPQSVQPQTTPRSVSDAVIAIRTRKLPDPAQIGNAGSFFKNPVVSAARHAQLAALWPQLVGFAQADGSVKLAAGWLIDQCGWKGRSLGAAGVYEKQALVLVNRGGATGDDVMRLAGAIQGDVMQRFGVALEAEPVVV